MIPVGIGTISSILIILGKNCNNIKSQAVGIRYCLGFRKGLVSPIYVLFDYFLLERIFHDNKNKRCPQKINFRTDGTHESHPTTWESTIRSFYMISLLKWILWKGYICCRKSSQCGYFTSSIFATIASILYIILVLASVGLIVVINDKKVVSLLQETVE